MVLQTIFRSHDHEDGRPPFRAAQIGLETCVIVREPAGRAGGQGMHKGIKAGHAQQHEGDCTGSRHEEVDRCHLRGNLAGTRQHLAQGVETFGASGSGSTSSIMAAVVVLLGGKRDVRSHDRRGFQALHCRRIFCCAVRRSLDRSEKPDRLDEV